MTESISFFAGRDTMSDPLNCHQILTFPNDLLPLWSPLPLKLYDFVVGSVLVQQIATG